jgi:hypothetical protein
MRPGRLPLIVLVGSLWLAGCVVGFDEGKLHGSIPGTDGGAPAPTPSDLGTIGPLCDDFSTYSTGETLPWWNAVNGTWRVVATGPAKALGQLDASMSRHDMFMAWHFGSTAADVVVQATINAPDGSNDNCVVARVVDANNYYKLCVHSDRRQQQGQRPQTAWDLEVVKGGVRTRLSSGATDGLADTHQLALEAQGDTLTPIVDTVTQTSVKDAALPQGAAGVATEASGVFTKVCITRP